MAMRNQFAVHEYLGPPRLSAAGGIVLTKWLINAAPADITEREQGALTMAREVAVEVQRIMKLRARLAPVNLEVENGNLDGCWGAIHDQVAAWTRIPNHANQQVAKFLLSSLFPDGLSFTTTKYEVQWVESANRLDRIDEESLEERLEALIHADLLPLLRRAHDVFGERLGVGETEVEIPDGAALLESIRDLSFLIANYARVMAGSIDIEDEESITRFKRALAPLRLYRDENAPDMSGESGESTEPGVDLDPETPIPEPPIVVDPGEPEPTP